MCNSNKMCIWRICINALLALRFHLKFTQQECVRFIQRYFLLLLLEDIEFISFIMKNSRSFDFTWSKYCAERIVTLKWFASLNWRIPFMNDSSKSRTHENRRQRSWSNRVSRCMKVNSNDVGSFTITMIGIKHLNIWNYEHLDLLGG